MNSTTILGILQLLGSIIYFAWAIPQLIRAIKKQEELIGFRILQTIIGPLVLALSGVILFFNGWRLDPLLQLQQICLSMFVVVHLFTYSFFAKQKNH